MTCSGPSTQPGVVGGPHATSLPALPHHLRVAGTPSSDPWQQHPSHTQPPHLPSRGRWGLGRAMLASRFLCKPPF